MTAPAYTVTIERDLIVTALLDAERAAVRAADLLAELGQRDDAHAARNIAQSAAARRECIE